ncbi:MAG: redox-regulated ATPase YchF, partial [Gemmatimonadota bacterium]
GLVGFPGTGKTTVFNALTGLAAETGPAGGRGKANVGVVKVPDPRIDALSALFRPRKTVYAEVRFSDVGGSPGSTGRALDAATLTAMREMDAMVQVVRGFEDAATGDPPRPAGELADFEAETILADAEVVERRLARLRRGERGFAREAELLERILTHLETGRALRALGLAQGEWASFTGFTFLSRKPAMAVVNVPEDAAGSDLPPEVRAFCEERGMAGFVLSAPVEAEIAQLPAEERAAFAREMGLAEPAQDRFIREAYALLDLISFFTVGPDEVRAWTIRRGTRAQEAGGKIHSDIERGFIRAEVMEHDDVLRLGTEAKVREAGRLRLEGKEYLVQDGDVAHFRFNV